MARIEGFKPRKHLNAETLLKTMHTGFEGTRDYHTGNGTHTLADSLIAGLAMFSLRNPSLLIFDERRYNAPHNFMTIYGMSSIPCDTSMGEILNGFRSQ